MDKIRAEENAAYVEAKADLELVCAKRLMCVGVRKALDVLRDYYALRDVMAQIMKLIEEEQSRGVIRTSPHREKRRWKVRLN